MVGLSLLFYGWWNPWYISLIVFSSVADFWTGRRIHSSDAPKVRRAWLLVSLITNLGVLAVFKYTPFVASNIAGIAGSTGAEVHWDFSSWVVPVGISFYTFQTLSYSIDIYRGQLEPTRSYRDFLLYVSFFPQLVAGPIVRAKDLLPQFRFRRSFSAAHFQAGLYHIILGLFLKIAVADNLAPVVERAFRKESIPDLTPIWAWLSVFYFSIQILADFAGYSGIAIGLAYVMGLRFPENFRCPYISRSLSEFWRRWHISLSQWLRDYLYISMGGNQKGRVRTLCFLMITMGLGGLWHGAAWTFIAWGVLHGLGLCFERLVRGGSSPSDRSARPTGALDLLTRLVQVALVFMFVMTTWVFFRSIDFEMARMMLGRMYVAPFHEAMGFEGLALARHLVLVLPVLALHLGQIGRDWYGIRASRRVQACVAALLLFLLSIIQRDAPTEFIYFQF